MRRETYIPPQPSPGGDISIHSLREEGDAGKVYVLQGREGISIHSLREEGDPAAMRLIFRRSQISIHSLREEGDLRNCSVNLDMSISIHSLREEGDCLHRIIGHKDSYFNPLPP